MDQEYELGEYGFEDDYDYSKHFKPMGSVGAVFMEAPVKKASGKDTKVCTSLHRRCYL